MRPITCLTACLGLLLLPNPGQAQQDKKGDPEPPVPQKAAAPKPDDEPDLVITPHTIRVQPTDPDGKGHWITMPRSGKLGSP